MSVSVIKEIKKEQKEKKKKIAFIADDIKNLSEFDIFHNATFGLMLAAQELIGNSSKLLLTKSNNLKIINNKVFAKFDEIKLRKEFGNHLTIKSTTEYSLDSLDIIFARKDPPINESYLSYIQTLCLVSKALIVNKPEGILKANEKLYALNFPKIIPPTLVTTNKNELLAFLKRHKEAVIKPLFNKGGHGVFYLKANNVNVNPILEASTTNGQMVLIQKYLPEVLKGDKRIILLNGDPIGGIIRVPKPGEFRAHISRGASFKLLKLSKRDIQICEALKPWLVKDGLYFTAIDVIGDYLIEVNVTCPANLQETEKAVKKPLAKEIINWALRKIIQ